MTPERAADARRRLGLSSGSTDHELWLAVRRFQMGAGVLVTGELDELTYQRLWETRLLRGPRPSDGGDALTGA